MSQACLNKAENEKTCPCKKINCENHGVCCKCIAAHRAKGTLTACMAKLVK